MTSLRDSDLGSILGLLPVGMVDSLVECGGYDELLEIVLDLGREPEATEKKDCGLKRRRDHPDNDESNCYCSRLACDPESGLGG